MNTIMVHWPHTPQHILNEKCRYMVTAATFNKEHCFHTKEDLDFLHDLLLELAKYYKWELEAWSVFSNHYHFIGYSESDPKNLRKLITHLHANSARKLNEKYSSLGRKIWYQYWDSKITFQKSYLARISYVMNNPVKHGLVKCAREYKWCSANWFKENALKSTYQTVMALKTETISTQEIDEFYPILSII